MGNKKIILRTKKPKEYFTGTLVKYWDEWMICCTTYSGGSNIPMLSILDWRESSERKLRTKIALFKKKYKLTHKP